MIRTLLSLFNRQFRDTETLYVLIFLVGLSITAFIISAVANVFSPPIDWADWFEGAFQNFATEIIGAIATYSLFELIIGRRNEQRRLITQMKSPDVATAKTALEQLRGNRGLVDGSLNETDLRGLQLPEADMRNAQMQGANLDGADLQETNLSRAVLEGASLRDAQLKKANFWLANLQGADLQDADMSDADMRLADMQAAILRRTNLKRARLVQAQLQSADLANANLKYAYLLGVNLQGANLAAALLDNTHFDENTILPDGAHWKNGTDLSRYTNSEHPLFWRRNTDSEGHTTTSIRHNEDL